jgi:hypothetical protein
MKQFKERNVLFEAYLPMAVIFAWVVFSSDL